MVVSELRAERGIQRAGDASLDRNRYLPSGLVFRNRKLFELPMPDRSTPYVVASRWRRQDVFSYTQAIA